jgi:hypothetical protein
MKRSRVSYHVVWAGLVATELIYDQDSAPIEGPTRADRQSERR